MSFGKILTIVCLLLAFFVFGVVQAEPTSGPLRICPDNPRYFADKNGKALLLVGSHVWYNLVDMGPEDPPRPFDYEAYLAWMKGLNHNFMRMWAWEMTEWDTKPNGAHARKDVTTFYVTPHPWLRTSAEKANDGKPKFDLRQFNPRYFERLRRRVEAAHQNGIYVSIMLFEGWAMQRIEDGWKLHPFNPQNNVNGINGDLNGDGKGLEVHELAVEAVTEIQKAYIRKVVDTVNDLNNVLYEISNENHPASTPWQYAMIRYIHEYEKSKPKQHPVGMTFQYQGGKNQDLFDSPADWISPNPEGGYRDNPPANDGKKVILTDTDHLWGIGGNQAWVWKSFTRGLNPIFMDPYDGVVLGKPADPQYESVRRSMGYALRLAQRLNLNRCKPLSDLSTTGYCLAFPGRHYLVYQPMNVDGQVRFAADRGGQYVIYQPQPKAKLDVKLSEGAYIAEWLDPSTGKTVSSQRIAAGGQPTTFTNPLDSDAVLFVCSEPTVR